MFHLIDQRESLSEPSLYHSHYVPVDTDAEIHTKELSKPSTLSESRAMSCTNNESSDDRIARASS